MEAELDELLSRARAATRKPVAVEALWDGDTHGWFVDLSVVAKRWIGYRHHHLKSYRDGGDIRIFNGQVPPWPEAQKARTIGEALAARLRVPFHFPSPDHPESECPHWWERGKGYPCRRCRASLLQAADCSHRGICHFCHLAQEHEQREAQWSEEERAGPRCDICNRPAPAHDPDWTLCASCRGRYEKYDCSRCGVTMRVLKTVRQDSLCSLCRARARLDALAPDTRDAFQRRVSEGMEHEAVDMLWDLGWSASDARDAVGTLLRKKPT